MKPSNIIKKAAALTLSLALAAGISACGQEKQEDSSDRSQEISFVLEWTPNTNHTGIYVAKAKGWYEDAGLSVTIQSPSESGSASPLVASGKAQFGVDVQESLGLELTLDNPLPITAVASIIDHNTSGLLSAKSKGIDSFSKLEGTTYASWDAPTELAVLRQTMTDAGCDYSKLNTVPAPATDAVSLIQSGSIDLAWVYEAWDVVAAQQAGVEYNFIKFSDQSAVLDFYTPLIIANNDYLETNPDQAKAFLSATAQGYEYAMENPEEAAQILVDAVPELDLAMITASQKFLAKEYKGDKAQWGTFDESRWTAFYDWMYDQKLIPQKLGKKGFTNDFLPQQQK